MRFSPLDSSEDFMGRGGLRFSLSLIISESRRILSEGKGCAKNAERMEMPFGLWARRLVI